MDPPSISFRAVMIAPQVARLIDPEVAAKLRGPT
jgi:hypothetical protein